MRLILTAATAIVLFLAMAGTASAQTFNVAQTTVSVTGPSGIPDSFVEPYTNVTNLTSSQLHVSIEVIENTLPIDWQMTICLANCFAPGQYNVDDWLEPNATSPLKITIMTGLVPATGYITVRLKNFNDEFESTTITYNVSTTSTSVSNISSPRQLVLAQNYPNPVSLGGSAVTTITYGVPRTSQVTLKVYNLLGKEIRTLVNDQRAPGLYSTLWNGRDVQGNLVPAGVYVYKLSNGKSTQTRRMLITR